MKNKINLIRTLFFVSICYFISSYSYGQIKFENIQLGAMQSIAYTTKYDDLIKLLEAQNKEVIKRKNEGKEEISFSMLEMYFEVLYSEKKELIYVKTRKYLRDGKFPDDDSNRAVPEKLEELKFKHHDKPIVTNADVFNPNVRYYDREDYPYEIIVSSMRCCNNEVYLFNKDFYSLDKFVKL